MFICALGGIFQTKVYKMIGNIEGIKTYIDGILLLRKDRLSKHIEQLSIIFGRLHAAGLNSMILIAVLGERRLLTQAM